MTNEQYQHRIQQLQSHGHQIFSIKFKRRNDKVVDGEVVARAGEERTMVCRLHVKKGVKGNDPGRRNRDRANMLITVFEMAGEGSGFKCVPVDSIIEVNAAPMPAE